MKGTPVQLTAVIETLDDMREKGIIGESAIGGAVAVAFYYQPIVTNDLDIFFLFDPPQTGIILSLETVYNYFRERGVVFDKEFIFIGDWPVQLIESSHDALWKEGVQKARKFSLGSTEVKVIPPEYLVAMWAQAGREKDIRKIQELDEGGVLDVASVREILDRFGLMATWRKIQGRLPNEYQF